MPRVQVQVPVALDVTEEQLDAAKSLAAFAGAVREFAARPEVADLAGRLAKIVRHAGRPTPKRR